MDCMEILNAFDLPEGERTAVPFGNGHINNTFLVRIAGAEEKYILQRINSYVFKKPAEVMENMRHVTEYLREEIRREGGDPARETLQLIPARSGECWAADAEGEVWRVMLFVPDTESPQLPDDLGVLEDCGRAFGRFARRLKDFPAASLHETIVDFHNTPVRLRQLEDAAARDACGRLKDVAEEMAFARAREAETRILTDALAAGKIPLRVTHNDTKVNNVLLDKKTGKAICVVDLDTVMPGLLAYDFGDAIRVGACSAEEDERRAGGGGTAFPGSGREADDAGKRHAVPGGPPERRRLLQDPQAGAEPGPGAGTVCAAGGYGTPSGGNGGYPAGTVPVTLIYNTISPGRNPGGSGSSSTKVKSGSSRTGRKAS